MWYYQGIPIVSDASQIILSNLRHDLTTNKINQFVNQIPRCPVTRGLYRIFFKYKQWTVMYEPNK